MAEDNKKKFSEIHTRDELYEYLAERGTNHATYGFYSKLTASRNVYELQENAVFLSYGKNWNDKNVNVNEKVSQSLMNF